VKENLIKERNATICSFTLLSVAVGLPQNEFFTSYVTDLTISNHSLLLYHLLQQSHPIGIL
jgi:hypothetical protein